MKVNKPYEKMVKLIEVIGRIPTLEEWLDKSGYGRTSYFEAKRMYKLVMENE